jgi:hypothetical protein
MATLNTKTTKATKKSNTTRKRKSNICTGTAMKLNAPTRRGAYGKKESGKWKGKEMTEKPSSVSSTIQWSKHTPPIGQGHGICNHTAPVTTDNHTSIANKLAQFSPLDSTTDVSLFVRPMQLLQKNVFGSGAVQQEEYRASQVARFRKAVRATLFQKVKFITSERMLEYGHVVSKTVLKALGLGTDAAVKERYWNAYRGCVNKALNDKRGNVNNEMKKAFLGTC